jgi:hypothetical protein
MSPKAYLDSFIDIFLHGLLNEQPEQATTA